MSNPYYYLKKAISQRNNICTPWEVRRELLAYLEWRCPPHKPLEIYTREEYHALVNRRKKRKPRRKKGEADPIKFVYDTVENERLEFREHNVSLDEEHVTDLDWIDAIARRQTEEMESDAYYGEF